MLRYLLVIVYLLFSASCSQEPSKIIYKGHNFYGKNITDNSIYEKPPVRSGGSKRTVQQEEVDEEIDNFITARSGDSLFLIAKRNKIPLRSLIEANNLEPPYKLYPGDKLKIPSKRNTHIVKYGENISIIASKYGISSNDITSINNLERPYIIRPGQILILPYNIVVPDDDKVSSGEETVRGRADNNETKAMSNAKMKFVYPVNGAVISEYGAIKNGVKNDGINIKAAQGTPVKAAADGKIVYVGNALKGYGNLIVIKHDNEWLSAYAHNDEVYVTKNQIVKAGEVISTVGLSGDVETSQLYFSLRQGRKIVDPKKYLSNF